MKNWKRWLGVVLALVVVLAIGFGLAAKKKQSATFESSVLSATNLSKTVLASGEVVSGVDLELSSKISGIVKRIPVRVGQKVKTGDILVQLDQQDQLAGVAQARAAVASAEASLQKVKDGATSEDVAVAATALANAEKSLSDVISQQEVLVNNAYRAMLSTGLSAEPAGSNISGEIVSISGTYTGTSGGEYKITVSQSLAGWQYAVSGPGAMSGNLITGINLPLSSSGLFVTFSSLPASPNDSWSVEVPNTKSSSYLTYLNAYTAAKETRQSAIVAAENVVASAKASLDLKKAAARPSDLAAAEASVLSARASLQAALASLENTIIRAPVAGTVTKVDVKVGEQATALAPVVAIQDVENLYVEANISESNIVNVKADQEVKYTFDAVPGKSYVGHVTAIDPSSTLVNGVVNYKVTASVDLEGVEQDMAVLVRPGMTANMTIIVAERSSVIAIPDRAIEKKEGKSYVKVVTDKTRGQFEEAVVTLGLEADGGYVEILSGLKAGQEIVTSMQEEK